ncbi:MAG TPA: YggS family pyridoxal phosphate-dependent enzyme [Gammaproteobacteria bacterium]
MQTLAHRLTLVREQISKAEQEFNRIPSSVQLLAVSKTQPPETVAMAFDLGQRDFGENYLQEALPKIQTLKALPITWHFIGQIQANKTRPLSEYFDWIHSVDRLKIAKRLSDQRPHNFKPLNVCLQVNLENEAGKGGVRPAELPVLAGQIINLPRIRLRGLMAIPSRQDTFEGQRRLFRQLRNWQTLLNAEGLSLDTLSMGMSADLTAAIAEGATIVRVGTAIFGERR